MISRVFLVAFILPKVTESCGPLNRDLPPTPASEERLFDMDTENDGKNPGPINVDLAPTIPTFATNVGLQTTSSQLYIDIVLTETVIDHLNLRIAHINLKWTDEQWTD